MQNVKPVTSMKCGNLCYWALLLNFESDPQNSTEFYKQCTLPCALSSYKDFAYVVLSVWNTGIPLLPPTLHPWWPILLEYIPSSSPGYVPSICSHKPISPPIINTYYTVLDLRIWACVPLVFYLLRAGNPILFSGPLCISKCLAHKRQIFLGKNVKTKPQTR